MRSLILARRFPASRVAIALLLTACATARRDMPSAESLGPIVTDRPDFTESAQVIPRGHAQLEGGYTASREGSAREHSLGELLLRVGLAPRAELRLTSNYAVASAGQEDEHGFQDASIGAKLGLLTAPRGALPALSLIAATSVPSGMRPFRDVHATPELKVVMAWELPRETAFGVNLNAARPADAAGRFAAHSWSATLGHSVAGPIGAYAELFALAEDRDASETRWANAGLTWAVSDAFQLDVRAGTRLGDGDGRGFFVGIGAARRW